MCKALEDLYQEGVEQGIERGIEQGSIAERERINRLNCMLAKQNRMEDIVRAASDTKYQQKLFEEFAL